MSMSSKYLEEKAQKIVDEMHSYHMNQGFLWFTKEVGDEYFERAKSLGESPNDVGARRILRMELQQKYGLLEVEALNVLNGYHIQEYVEKYKRIQKRTPTEIIRRSKDDEEPESNDGSREEW